MRPPRTQDDLFEHIGRQTAALEALAATLAPQKIEQTITFNGEVAPTGNSPGPFTWTPTAIKIMQIGTKFNKLEHALTAGKVWVFFGSIPHNANRPDRILDAAVPGPIHFPPKESRTISFAVAPGSAPVFGLISVQNY